MNARLKKIMTFLICMYVINAYLIHNFLSIYICALNKINGPTNIIWASKIIVLQ